jgi:hypothetical protein
MRFRRRRVRSSEALHLHARVLGRRHRVLNRLGIRQAERELRQHSGMQHEYLQGGRPGRGPSGAADPGDGQHPVMPLRERTGNARAGVAPL